MRLISVTSDVLRFFMPSMVWSAIKFWNQWLQVVGRISLNDSSNTTLVQLFATVFEFHWGTSSLVFSAKAQEGTSIRLVQSALSVYGTLSLVNRSGTTFLRHRCVGIKFWVHYTSDKSAMSRAFVRKSYVSFWITFVWLWFFCKKIAGERLTDAKEVNIMLTIIIKYSNVMKRFSNCKPSPESCRLVRGSREEVWTSSASSSGERRRA